MKSSFTKQEDLYIKNVYESGKTSQEIADFFSVYKQSVLNSLKRTDTPRRTDWSRASGEKNGRWKGGIRLIKGYRHVFLPKHHLSRSDGWVAEHRLIAEESIGRRLAIKEVVHHKDGNRINNSKSNLVVYQNNAVHLSNHSHEWSRNEKGRWKK